MLVVDEVRIRGNMFVLGVCFGLIKGLCEERICGESTLQSIDLTL